MSDATSRLNAALEGRYAIERELGEGGMATVYLAKDLKHNRNVALKVLKPELAAVVGAERFLAEIETTANLQHPHILPLFDSGEAESFLFYVMPHVQGESLRERIDREKQLGVDDSVAITQKVAGALDYAHGHGVVHRDIKPGNILLSEQGEPLVADFGIALAVAQAGAGRITETGLSLGTPHYMSPEQATGDRDVDPRSDVYALGCVLYEMLAGQPPFSATTAQAVLVKILTSDAPSITSERRTVPPNVGAALARSLEKLPADRFTSAAEFATALADESFTYRARPRMVSMTARQEPMVATAPAGPARPWHRDGRFMVSLGTGIVLAALAAWGWLRPTPIPEPGVPTRTQVTGLDVQRVNGWLLAISPEGRWIVAGHVEGSTRYLYIRPAEDPEWRQLRNTEGARDPTFSPDGQWVAFRTGGTISKVPITGGPALPIAAGQNPHWGLNDTIVYNAGNALYRVAASGGEPELLFDSDTVNVSRPHLLPNGRGVVFASGAPPLDAAILLFEIETGEVRAVVPSGNQPRYVPTGHLIYGHGDQALMGVPFDLETLQRTGTPVTLLPEMEVRAGGASQFAVSETGTLIYDRDDSGDEGGGGRVFVEVDLDGVESPLPLGAGPLDVPRYSPDGSKIAYEDGAEIRIYDVVTGASPQFTVGGGVYPVWSPDGEYLYFSEGGPGSATGYRRPADGREEARRLWDRPGNYVRDVSPGDSIVIVREMTGDRGRDLLLMRQGADSAEFEGFLTAEWNEANAEISPDGRWVAYQSDESGEPRIYVHSFPVVTGQHSISPGLGTDPVWSPDGRTLYYRSGPQFFAVAVTTEPAFTVSAPDLLFDEPRYGGTQSGGWVRNWDIHPDGSRFVMVSGGGGSGASLSEVYLVTNWFEELRQRMGN